MSYDDPTVTFIGNLTGDPELRFTPSGAAVCNISIAHTPRIKKGDEWVDGEPIFMRGSVWRQQAENVAETFTRGQRVVVIGRLKQRSYETREGEKRTVVELDVDEVAASVKFATAKIIKAQRGSSGGGFGAGAQQQQSGGFGQQQQPADDPWGSAPAGGYDDQPPF